MSTAIPFTPSACFTSTTIKPQPNAHGKIVKLSAIDQIAPRDYISSCLYFPVSQNADKRHIFHLFERALVNTIIDIPELACSVRQPIGSNREEVELLFDMNQGARLNYKDYTAPELRTLWTFGTFHQLERDYFPLNIPRHIVFGTSAKLVSGASIPALVLQCNFISGGLILGTCLHVSPYYLRDIFLSPRYTAARDATVTTQTSQSDYSHVQILTDMQHVAGDGVCNFILHKTIGMHLAAITQELGLRTFPITPLERSSAVEGEQGVTLEEFPDWKLTETSSTFLNPTNYEAAEAQSIEHGIFSISAEKLSLLKNHVLKSATNNKLSTTEAICAFLWRHVVLARQLDHCRYPEAKLSITVDARERMENPPLPSNYWGNFAEPNAVARASVACLQNEEDGPKIYVELASSVKRAIAAVNNRAVRRLVGLLNQMPKSTSLTWNVDRYPGPDMLIVCLQAHRYNDIYFGSDLGYPSAFRVTVGDTEGKPDGRCIILPPRHAEGHGLELIVQYSSGTLERLESNTEFSQFFTRRN
ncbi:trichothecene 3-O-acetyltransferase [Fusarium agapanthi]|uniref:Trichothecene 3-O-acetyltransferase n=1 Tax=Fusarium agapanthi TaxID=1803897 RepID=A0A9P5B0P5_9HYPO|nr:trichothecene 3-O-acetyltransferase [Fusarium agapanthi]